MVIDFLSCLCVEGVGTCVCVCVCVEGVGTCVCVCVCGGGGCECCLAWLYNYTT